MAFIELKNATKVYHSGGGDIYANKDISLKIAQGELIILLGESGAGKSTLLNILGGMDSVTSGDVLIDGQNLAGASRRELTAYRRENVGFVFQFYNLIPNLTAKENVELASQIVRDAMPAEEALKIVGLEKRMNNFPAQLSGGQQQRVAISRAIAKNPKLLLCDEPTGALDFETGKKVLKVLQDMSRRYNSTTIIVTHNAALAPIGDKVFHIHDGQVAKVEVHDHPQDISQISW
ncbi:ABC transporter ATP-binding protein [Lactobacillus corticis]|uniref:Antimicrobial peptide ABC transporter ATP-binding protein n=1 Tax=Lactobacillus corticis TaxID=2201249 RepID=A0A916QGC2_9LACO|nr:ABC transporter ATP-binding protein [Lactobacillus corticis]GFZ26810.1 antimicrobial peptide ABC transporter ATP-binding protein [Lactobacillus corticis]